MGREGRTVAEIARETGASECGEPRVPQEGGLQPEAAGQEGGALEARPLQAHDRRLAGGGREELAQAAPHGQEGVRAAAGRGGVRGLLQHGVPLRAQGARGPGGRPRGVPRPGLGAGLHAGRLRPGRLQGQGREEAAAPPRGRLPLLKRRPRAGLPGRERRVRPRRADQHLRVRGRRAEAAGLRQRHRCRQEGLRPGEGVSALRGPSRPLRLRPPLLQPGLREREGQRREQGRRAQAELLRAHAPARQRGVPRPKAPRPRPGALEEGALQEGRERARALRGGLLRALAPARGALRPGQPHEGGRRQVRQRDARGAPPLLVGPLARRAGADRGRQGFRRDHIRRARQRGLPPREGLRGQADGVRGPREPAGPPVQEAGRVVAEPGARGPAGRPALVDGRRAALRQGPHARDPARRNRAERLVERRGGALQDGRGRLRNGRRHGGGARRGHRQRPRRGHLRRAGRHVALRRRVRPGGRGGR